MLTQYKNELYKLIQEAGLDTSLFKGKELLDDPKEDSKAMKDANFLIRYFVKNAKPLKAFLIYVRGSRCYFVIIPSRDDHSKFTCAYTLLAPDEIHSQYLPASPDNQEHKYYNIYQLKAEFSYWLDNHAKPFIESEKIVNLWQQVETFNSFVSTSIIAHHDTDQFTPQDRQQIKSALQRFVTLITEKYHPTQEQITEISHRLDYLADSTERLNKFDWQGLLISTILSILVTLSLDTSVGKELFVLLLKAFEYLPHILPKL